MDFNKRFWFLDNEKKMTKETAVQEKVVKIKKEAADDQEEIMAIKMEEADQQQVMQIMKETEEKRESTKIKEEEQQECEEEESDFPIDLENCITLDELGEDSSDEQGKSCSRLK